MLGSNIKCVNGFKALNGPFEEFTALSKGAYVRKLLYTLSFGVLRLYLVSGIFLSPNPKGMSEFKVFKGFIREFTAQGQLLREFTAVNSHSLSLLKFQAPNTLLVIYNDSLRPFEG